VVKVHVSKKRELFPEIKQLLIIKRKGNQPLFLFAIDYL
jgi:hypothetical protein